MRWLMVSLTQWTWVWVDWGSWWWTGRPGVLWFMGSQRVRHDWVTELNWTEDRKLLFINLWYLFILTNESWMSTYLWEIQDNLKLWISKADGASLVAQTVKNLPAVLEPGIIPGLGRSPGKGNDYPLHYFCLENPMDRGVWQATVHGVSRTEWLTLSLSKANTEVFWGRGFWCISFITFWTKACQ